MIKPQGRQRISKEDMYLNSAENFAYRSTCLKRKYGAVIVKDDAVDTFIEQVGRAYRSAIGYKADFYVVKIGDGPAKL